MELDYLIASIRLLEDDGLKLRTIESELKMPLNMLSGMLNKKRPFPPKWQNKLTAYVMKVKANKATLHQSSTS